MTIAWRIRQLAETTSTNDEVKKAAEASEPEGLAIWALKQTAGRGRHGRQWESPEGNLYVSVLLRPDCELQQAGQYGLIAALAICDTIKSLLPNAEVMLKWPNDVLVSGKKISGILLESSLSKTGRVEWLVIGIGLNVEHHPDNALYPATSLRAEGLTPPPLPQILDRLLERISAWVNTFIKQGFKPVHEAWLAAAAKGKTTIRLGDRTIEGTFDGLDDSGNLILKLADGTKQIITAGDVMAG